MLLTPRIPILLVSSSTKFPYSAFHMFDKMTDQNQQQTPPPSMAPSPLQSPPSQQQQHSTKDEMMSCVVALEAALLPCLPARELQAVDRSAHSSNQIDVERHAREFMEAAKKLQLYFIGLQHEDQPTKEEILRKDISVMEEELKTKTELINKHEKLILRWRKELKDQLDKHIVELERV